MVIYNDNEFLNKEVRYGNKNKVYAGIKERSS